MKNWYAKLVLWVIGPALELRQQRRLHRPISPQEHGPQQVQLIDSGVLCGLQRSPTL